MKAHDADRNAIHPDPFSELQSKTLGARAAAAQVVCSVVGLQRPLTCEPRFDCPSPLARLSSSFHQGWDPLALVPDRPPSSPGGRTQPSLANLHTRHFRAAALPATLDDRGDVRLLHHARRRRARAGIRTRLHAILVQSTEIRHCNLRGATVMAKKSGKRANAFDQHIAVRLRAKREELGRSQTEVANRLGVTFQQVQKYEKATNRISAGRLWQLAKYLNVPIDYFFEGLK